MKELLVAILVFNIISSSVLIGIFYLLLWIRAYLGSDKE